LSLISLHIIAAATAGRAQGLKHLGSGAWAAGKRARFERTLLGGLEYLGGLCFGLYWIFCFLIFHSFRGGGENKVLLSIQVVEVKIYIFCLSYGPGRPGFPGWSPFE